MPSTSPNTNTTADVILDELELILAKRDHPPRDRQESSADADRASAERQKVMQDVRSHVGDAADADAALMRARVAMLNQHVTGLAFSGGGIRSGTFAVGFLQGLSNLGLLGRFDYLSTVSGGGYAGGWLAAWLKREGDVKNVQLQLDFSRIRQAEAERGGFNLQRGVKPTVDAEPQPLRHLRSFSSYLFPHPEILSADLWAVIMIWARNVSINLLMLFPLAMIAALLARLGVFFFSYLNADTLPSADSIVEGMPGVRWGWFWALLFLIVGLLSAMAALILNAEALPEFRIKNGKRAKATVSRAWIAVIVTTVAAFCLTASSRWLLWHLGEWFAEQNAGPARRTIVSNILNLMTAHLDLLDPPTFLIVMTAFAVFMSVGALLIGIRSGKPQRAFLRAAFIAGASAGFLFVLVLGMIRSFARTNHPDLMATFAIPGALGVVIALTIVEVAIAGRAMSEAEREWWGRFSARLAIIGIFWLVGMATILYLPGLFLAGGAWARIALASGWVGSTALGVLTGRFVLPKLQAQRGGQTMARLAALAPPIFLIGLGGVVGLLASLLLNSPSLGAPGAADFPAFEYYLRGVAQTSAWLIVALLIGFSVLAGLGFWLIDVNLFSLNAMYANRLVRCYLGASRPVGDWKPRWDDSPRVTTILVGAPSISRQDPPPLGRVAEPMPKDRDPNPVTGFAVDDDLPLVELRIGCDFGSRDPSRPQRTYWGPHLLINTTLNLVADPDLALRSRKGESFVLSPLYCGAETVGYKKVPERGQSLRNLTLGRAMAVSGAAVDPNMQFYQSGALTALLALFNARLGAWIQNPRDGGEWDARSPRFGGLLVTELLGDTVGTGRYVHLSDGGHFENMGVYELIRRRCRYIVAIDAAGEYDSPSSNLATLIRLCRIDFGIRIQIDAEPLRPEGDQKLTRAHAVVGRIRYDDVDQGQLPGVLVYVKTSMTGDEPPDVQFYARRDTAFPYQPTDLRQSFDEEQFECYRSLGDHIATEVFQDAVHQVSDLEDTKFTDYIPRLFAALGGRWDDAPECLDADFIESTQAWIALQRDLRVDPALARLSRQLFPELAAGPAPPADSPVLDYDRAEVHAVSQMLQIMENTWLSLHLPKTSDLPINRGWVNVFRRWVNTPAFQSLWSVLRTEYGSNFARFCEEELHMRSIEPVLRQIDPSLADDARKFQERAVAQLALEHEREWPGPEVPRIGRLIELSQKLSDTKPPAWLIVQEAPPAGGPIDESYVVGIILVAEFNELIAEFPGVNLSHAERLRGQPLEFFVWMRRGFRSTNLGSPRVREVVTELLAPALGVDADKVPTLWARYPREGEHGDDDQERGVWLSFLARFNFHRVYAKTAGTWKSTLLKRLG
jgi:hypothetical protein